MKRTALMFLLMATLGTGCGCGNKLAGGVVIESHNVGLMNNEVILALKLRLVKAPPKDDTFIVQLGSMAFKETSFNVEWAKLMEYDGDSSTTETTTPRVGMVLNEAIPLPLQESFQLRSGDPDLMINVFWGRDAEGIRLHEAHAEEDLTAFYKSRVVVKH